MVRPVVTYLDVSKSTQQLTAAGKIPTIDSVRNALERAATHLGNSPMNQTTD